MLIGRHPPTNEKHSNAIQAFEDRKKESESIFTTPPNATIPQTNKLNYHPEPITTALDDGFLRQSVLSHGQHFDPCPLI